MSSASAPTRTTRRSSSHQEHPRSTGRPLEHDLGVRLAAEDERVLPELFTTYGGRILGLALRVLHDRQLAEEVVQETILRVWRHATTFDPTCELDPWLFRIARNVAYDMGRTRSRRPQAQWGDPTVTLDELTDNDEATDPQAATDALEVQWAVRAAIDDLPEGERDVVRLQHLSGLRHEEIATRLGISVGTVKSRSHRAHRRLQSALDEVRRPGADPA
ncbi:MAG: RNA polymerase sigma factor [Ilumatobacter sp.]